MCYAGKAVEGGGLEGAVDEERVMVYIICQVCVLQKVGGWGGDLRHTNANEMTPIAWKTPSLIHIISFPIFPLLSAGTVHPCVTTARRMINMLMSASVLAFASFAISLYRDNG